MTAFLVILVFIWNRIIGSFVENFLRFFHLTKAQNGVLYICYTIAKTINKCNTEYYRKEE